LRLILCITKQRTLYNSDKVLEPALNLQQGTLNSLRLQNSFRFRSKQTPEFLGNPISSRSGHLQSKTCLNAVNNPQIANRTMTTWHIVWAFAGLAWAIFSPELAKVRVPPCVGKTMPSANMQQDFTRHENTSNRFLPCSLDLESTKGQTGDRSKGAAAAASQTPSGLSTLAAPPESPASTTRNLPPYFPHTVSLSLSLSLSLIAKNFSQLFSYLRQPILRKDRAAEWEAPNWRPLTLTALPISQAKPWIHNCSTTWV
jgi:hypothetical protein